MNCKFHPTAEAVTKCDVCGAELCSMCAKGAFYENDGKPVCLECSLRGAEEELAHEKANQKDDIKNGIIASIIWIVGVCVVGSSIERSFVVLGIGFLVMLVAAIVFCGGFKGIIAVAKDPESSGFSKIIKNIVLYTLICPFFVIFVLISDKMDVSRANKKVKKIKAALGNANR